MRFPVHGLRSIVSSMLREGHDLKGLFAQAITADNSDARMVFLDALEEEDYDERILELIRSRHLYDDLGPWQRKVGLCHFQRTHFQGSRRAHNRW